MKLEIVNRSDRIAAAWWPTKIDFEPPFASGTTPGCRFVVGPQRGLETRALSVFSGLSPGERRIIDLSEASFGDFSLPEAPPCDAWLGGVSVKLGDAKLQRVSTTVHGAGYRIHYTGRVTPMLFAHLWLRWFPDQPGWCPGEILLCGSNPNVPDMIAPIPPGLRLRVGDAQVLVPGLPTDAELMRDGDWLASGQTRALPLTLIFHDHASEQDVDSAAAWHLQQVAIRGVQKLMPHGNPLLPESFDAQQWSDDLLPRVVAAQHGWLDSPLDPAMVSGASGAQGAQSWVGGPAMAHASAVWPLYLGALDKGWPCVHQEEDGSIIHRDGHPNLRLYYGQPNTRICSDWLGKPRTVTSAESHGYLGPEDEHDFDWVATAGHRLMDSDAAAHLFTAQAAHWLHRWVVVPPGNWLTKARGVGWMAMWAAELYDGLPDRELAAVVAARFQAVVDQLVIPIMRPDDAWWGWDSSPSIGASPTDLRTQTWQTEVMCVGLYRGGMACGHSPTVDFAYEMAEKILARGWKREPDGRWIELSYASQDGHDNGVHDVYRHFGMKACDVMLKKDPHHVAAGEIWRQRYAEARGDLKALAWFVPMEVRP